MTRLWPALIAPIVLGSLAAAADESQSARAKTMYDMARGVALKAAGQPLAMRDQPVYRFDDPARQFSDGTVWAYGTTGRPAALLTISLERKAGGTYQWLHELTSLATGPMEGFVRSGSTTSLWAPEKPGLTLKPIPGAPAPGDDEAKRLRQMRELARRFKAFEFFKPYGGDVSLNAKPERYELRLLTQPVHRYKDPATGLIDGSMFLIAFGQNPELVIVIEARREGQGPPVWTYGVQRISGAETHVNFDDREVAGWPDSRDFGPRTSYYIFAVPAPDVEK